MALQASGAISLDQIHVEVGGTSGTQVSLNDTDIRGIEEAAGKTVNNTSETQIDFANFYGANGLVVTFLPNSSTGVYSYSINTLGKDVRLEPDGNGAFSLSSVVVQFSRAQAVTITGTSFSEQNYDIGRLSVDGTVRITVSGDFNTANPPASATGSWSGTIPAGGIVEASYTKDGDTDVSYDDADFRITWT